MASSLELPFELAGRVVARELVERGHRALLLRLVELREERATNGRVDLGGDLRPDVRVRERLDRLDRALRLRRRELGPRQEHLAHLFGVASPSREVLLVGRGGPGGRYRLVHRRVAHGVSRRAERQAQPEPEHRSDGPVHADPQRHQVAHRLGGSDGARHRAIGQRIELRQQVLVVFGQGAAEVLLDLGQRDLGALRLFQTRGRDDHADAPGHAQRERRRGRTDHLDGLRVEHRPHPKRALARVDHAPGEEVHARAVGRGVEGAQDAHRVHDAVRRRREQHHVHGEQLDVVQRQRARDVPGAGAQKQRGHEHQERARAERGPRGGPRGRVEEERSRRRRAAARCGKPVLHRACESVEVDLRNVPDRMVAENESGSPGSAFFGPAILLMRALLFGSSAKNEPTWTRASLGAGPGSRQARSPQFPGARHGAPRREPGRGGPRFPHP